MTKQRKEGKFLSKLDNILKHRPTLVPSAVLDKEESSSTHPETDESEKEEIDDNFDDAYNVLVS